MIPGDDTPTPGPVGRDGSPTRTPGSRFHDDDVRPDRKPGVSGVVHLHTLAVGVVAIDDLDLVLLVGQYRFTLHRYSWDTGGRCAAQRGSSRGGGRQLAEETRVRARTWRELIRFSLTNSTSDETRGHLHRDRAHRGRTRPRTAPKTSLFDGCRSPTPSRRSDRASCSTR